MNASLHTPAYRLSELACRFNLELRGSGDVCIQGVGTLAQAKSHQITFLANPQYRNQLPHTTAGAVIVRAEDAIHSPAPILISQDPYLAYGKIAALFDTTHLPHHIGIHPTAVIAQDTHIAATATIAAHCVIDNGAVIGPHAVIGPGCIIGRDCQIGAHSVLTARVTLVTRVKLGEHVLIHPGAVIGADGFGLAFDKDRWLKIPQMGGVTIGNYCEIGANCTIDRGTLEDTILEDDVRLDNQIQIAHNVVIGAHTAMAGCSAVAGSARIGRYCLIGGGAGILGHLTIADRVTITAMTLVTHSIDLPGQYSSGVPIQENRQWRRNAARFKHLDELARRLHTIEKELKE